MSIRTKILIPMIAVAVLTAAAVLISNIILFSRFIDQSATSSVNASATVTNHQVEMQKSLARNAALYLSENETLAEAIMGGDHDTLLTLTTKLQADSGADFCTITDPQGIVILRSHEPENSGDSVANQANVQSAMAGAELTAIETGTAVRLSVRSGAPIYNDQDELVGVVSIGFRLDTNNFVDQVKTLTANETTVFLGDERIATTVQNEDGTRAVGTKAAANVSETVLAGNTYMGEALIVGRQALTHYAPLEGPDGEVIGMIFSGQYLDVTTGTVWSFVSNGLVIVAIMLIIAVVVILVVSGRIVAPIRSMTAAAITLASGDTTVDIQVNTKDEMHTLGEAFEQMIQNIRRQADVIREIANGNLAVDVEVRCPKDVMGNALKTMLELNNSVFSNIMNASAQVSGDSQQIANSSQSLAQGATEQTATIEELSGALAEITQKTKVNADMAEQAAKLADTIKSNAENGSRQMDEMITAVKEINSSSQNISKVIKVIDDIAFQTNILALNAAVEAARAGQHGKGFAVVADEVRNLASKSADAAKNTSSMIQDSMEKAEFGSRIAGETAESLGAIIAGINESNRLIAEIARLSEEQSKDITQVDSGIDQVAQVVQQNSATAQENAAASHQLSSSSGLLKEMIGKFELRERADESSQQQPQRRSAPPVSGAQSSAFALSGNSSDKY